MSVKSLRLNSLNEAGISSLFYNIYFGNRVSLPNIDPFLDDQLEALFAWLFHNINPNFYLDLKYGKRI